MTENRKIMGVLLEEANNQISEVKQSERTITVPTTSGDVNSDLQGFAN
jgi:hypothetical protein